jgi:hypothetical protein
MFEADADPTSATQGEKVFAKFLQQTSNHNIPQLRIPKVMPSILYPVEQLR